MIATRKTSLTIATMSLVAMATTWSAPRRAAADIWVSSAGGNATELEHRLDVSREEDLARIEMRRVVRNNGHKTADLVLAIRVPRDTVATGLKVAPAGHARLQWAGPDLLVLVLPQVGPTQDREATLTLRAPMAMGPTAFELELPGSDEPPGMAPRRVFVAGEREVPTRSPGHATLGIQRRPPAVARASHFYLPLDEGGLLLATIQAPRYFTTRPNPARSLAVLDVGPEARSAGLRLAAMVAARFARGTHQFLLPGDPPTPIAEGFVSFPELAAILDARFPDVAPPPAVTPRQDLAAMVAAAPSLLAGNLAPCRLLLVTDREAPTAAEIAAVTGTLTTLPPGSLVQVLVLRDTTSGLGLRDDAHPLAAVARHHGGIVMGINPGSLDPDGLAHVMGHLVRPLWVDDLELVLDREALGEPGANETAEPPSPIVVPAWGTLPGDRAVLRSGRDSRPGTAIASLLPEGGAATTIRAVPAQPPTVWWRARLWTGVWTLESQPSPALETHAALRAVAASWYPDLSLEAQDRIAGIVRAVTPRWSWHATPNGSTWTRR